MHSIRMRTAYSLPDRDPLDRDPPVDRQTLRLWAVKRLVALSGSVVNPFAFAKILDPPLEDAGKTSGNPGQ